MGAVILPVLQPFRWLLDRWRIFRSRRLALNADVSELSRIINDQRSDYVRWRTIKTDRHAREIESKDSTIALQQREIKFLLASNETMMAKLSALQAALGRQQAESENGIRRLPPAGGSAS